MIRGNIRIASMIAPLAAGIVIACAQEPEVSPDSALAALGSPEPGTRIEALRELMTSLDPRIPDALLPLLRDEGDSIRRLAARGIGSRWWQIPPARRKEFINALEKNLHSDEANMARRAIALLSGRYRSSDAVYPSPNGRWVAYERRKLPCVIDTVSNTEELVGWEPEPYGDTILFAPAWGERADDEITAFWHPRSTMVALIMQTRRDSNVWVWQPGGKLRQLETEEVCAQLGPLSANINGLGGVCILPKSWQGNTLVLDVSYALMGDDDLYGRSATLLWDADTDTLALADKR